jgi:hypothetical protein
MPSWFWGENQSLFFSDKLETSESWTNDILKFMYFQQELVVFFCWIPIDRIPDDGSPKTAVVHLYDNTIFALVGGDKD